MKKNLFLLSFMLFALAQAANSKPYLLMGKVVDADGNDVLPVSVVASHNGVKYTATLKGGGLYYTDMMPEGEYDVAINMPNTAYTTKVVLKNPGLADKPMFYNFKIVGREAIPCVSNDDPFAETALLNSKNAMIIYDFPPRAFSQGELELEFNLLPLQGGFHFRMQPAKPKRQLGYGDYIRWAPQRHAGYYNNLFDQAAPPLWDYIKKRKR
jgi:hypothetical protein